MLTASEIISKYISFFEERGHKKIANSPLVLQNDPTTLFTSSGMQPLLPYLLGESHPEGTRLVNVQNCIRTQDIEEVGDNRHTTFFRMLGNWGLGDYFKKEEISWFWEFLTKELSLPKEKLYITVFKGIDNIPEDEEAISLWTDILTKEGLDPKERIYRYSDKSNWWSRAGVPSNMPVGEPGGPSTEIFYEFTNIKHDTKFGKECHPNCDCGRFMEIGNSVFMQYIKQEDGSFAPLPKNNIDFGGGLERLAAAVNNDPDVFTTDLYKEVVKEIGIVSTKGYGDLKYKLPFRIIADHMKAATYLILNGVTPSNKEQGYVLRRLLRRSAVKMYFLKGNQIHPDGYRQIIDSVLRTEKTIDGKVDVEKDKDIVYSVVKEEINKFSKTIQKGILELDKNIDRIDDVAFDMYQSYGFPFEILQEIVHEKGKTVNEKKFKDALQKHKEQSKTASVGMFRGGLADHSERTIMGHTATHLLHQALRDILGSQVHQTGSNITTERVRFDFNYDKKLTDEEIQRVQSIVNEKIKEDLPVHFEIMPLEKAQELGAIGLFMDTYGENVKIYFIGPSKDQRLKTNDQRPYSIEFCGGPHVEHTGVLQSVQILKQENLGKNQKRLYLTMKEAK